MILCIAHLLLCSVAELPSPSLASITELKDIKAHFVRATNPSELGYTYEDLKGFDEIKVTLIPEKKGALLKHNEYTVESRVSFDLKFLTFANFFNRNLARQSHVGIKISRVFITSFHSVTLTV